MKTGSENASRSYTKHAGLRTKLEHSHVPRDKLVGLWAHSKTALRTLRMGKVRVQFPMGPQVCSAGLRRREFPPKAPPFGASLAFGGDPPLADNSPPGPLAEE